MEVKKNAVKNSDIPSYQTSNKQNIYQSFSTLTKGQKVTNFNRFLELIGEFYPTA